MHRTINSRCVLQLSGIQRLQEIQVACYFIGFGLHYFWMTSFCIMTFIALDISVVFASCKPWYHHITRSKKVMGCWVFSATFTGLCVVFAKCTALNITYDSDRGICFIQPAFYLLLLFVFPVVIFITINTICYVTTVISMHCTVSPPSNHENQNMYIFIKMFSLMGITWFFGFLPPLLKINELWYLFIVSNTLHGLYIFLAFGFNKKVRTSLFSSTSTLS